MRTATTPLESSRTEAVKLTMASTPAASPSTASVRAGHSCCPISKPCWKLAPRCANPNISDGRFHGMAHAGDTIYRRASVRQAEPMTHGAAPAVARQCDVAVVGGSAAGLATALQIVRQRRSVIVVDSGEPRNALARHMHSFLGRDRAAPAELIADGRAEVRGYGGEILTGHVDRVTRVEDQFCVEISGGNTVFARRVVAATGLVDELPEVEGLAEHWGRTVVHCPFCHGYEVRDQRIVQLATHPTGLQVTHLWRHLTAHLTVLLDNGVEVDAAQTDALRSAGVDVRSGTARRLVSSESGCLEVELDDGSRIEADAVAIRPRFRPRAEPFAPLGLRPEPHPTGVSEAVAVDALGATSIDGLYAAGNITDPSHQVLQAAAHGSLVGVSVARSLAAEDIRTAPQPSGATDWDHRYSGEPVWSGNPNGSLVTEVQDLKPGRALDVGAGEGGDAIWLAEHGWTVTANDISSRALEHIRAAAKHRGLSITCQLADANAKHPYVATEFDLVCASYAAIPRTPDLRGVHNILDALAPGGTLIVISHDLEAMRDKNHQHQPYDPDAYLHIGDFVAALGSSADLVIDVNEKRPRPPGSATAAHHVDDQVLRAHRRLPNCLTEHTVS